MKRGDPSPLFPSAETCNLFIANRHGANLQGDGEVGAGLASEPVEGDLLAPHLLRPGFVIPTQDPVRHQYHPATAATAICTKHSKQQGAPALGPKPPATGQTQTVTATVKMPCETRALTPKWPLQSRIQELLHQSTINFHGGACAGLKNSISRMNAARLFSGIVGALSYEE